MKDHVKLLRMILAALFLALAYTFCQQILNLSVDRTEIILRPCGNGGVQLGRQAQWHLLLLTLVHISTSFRN